jgi:3-phosphoshikimate 1-carboxyvinyltransferase
MILKVSPTPSLKGSIYLPASKSYSIRAFIVGACGGESQIIRPSTGDDAVVAIRVARALGCDVRCKKDTWHLRAFKGGSRIRTIDVGESGTVLRFLLPLLPLHTDHAVITGQGTLIGRPNWHLLDALRRQGLKIQGQGEDESVPIQFNGGEIKGGTITIDGSLSSQFVSALLIVASCLPKDTKIKITGSKIVSHDYIIMTLQILEKAGIRVVVQGDRGFSIKGKQKFQGLKNFTVPSDYGLAAFLIAAACLVNSDVELRGSFGHDLIQADGHIFDFLKTMGAQIARSKDALKIKGPFKLKGGTFSLQACPDLVPIMAVLALFAEGKTTLKDIHHARAKESDRISDLRQELLKVGAQVQEKSNALIIHPLTKPIHGAVLSPHRDHRLAMAFAVLGLKLGVTVNDIECSHKSYPNFVHDFKALGAGIWMGR